jgi:AcrR family transcriptional regulator
MAAKTPRRRLPKAERRRVIEGAASALFAERGYAGTRLEDIAAAAGVTKQLLYQHFSSKKELHMALLAKHRDGLLERLAAGMSRAGPLADRIPGVADRWFAYVEENPYASAMLFRDTTGDPHIEAAHRRIQVQSRDALLPLVQKRPTVDAELAWEALRAVLQGLALWWYDHPDVPRRKVVAAAVAAVWTGYERRLQV